MPENSGASSQPLSANEADDMLNQLEALEGGSTKYPNAMVPLNWAETPVASSPTTPTHRQMVHDKNDEERPAGGAQRQMDDNVNETMAFLRERFEAADLDGSGILNREELGEMLRQYYKREGVSRSVMRVQQELGEAMKQFDTSGDGGLNFDEASNPSPNPNPDPTPAVHRDVLHV
jgi:hypothetical protein